MKPFVTRITDSAETLHALLHSHRLVLFEPEEPIDLVRFAERLGEIQEWSFGRVNELKIDRDKKNYLYTERAVPFHWDGAFTARTPHFIAFQCSAAPSSGGETLFADAIAVLAKLPPHFVEALRNTRVTYTTEKIVHFGGSFTAALVGEHPCTREPVLRFAEPVFDVNPVALSGIDPELVDQLSRALRDPACCVAHRWRPNQVLVADNFALLHGRNAFDPAEPRHLRRVNIY
jgi:alpha-ketoglutarate-dependent taurine dioxygenase